MYCGECGKECSARLVDEGIGPFEFWGSRGTHHEYVVVSSCCEATVYEDKDLTLEYYATDLIADEEAAKADYYYELERDRELDWD